MLHSVAVNPSCSWTLVGALAALGAVAGCGGVSLQVGDGAAGSNGGGTGQGGAGQGGGGSGHDSGADAATTCLGLDEATCAATPRCRTQYCEICPGSPTFAGCATPGAPVACPTIACVQPTCGSLSEPMCKSRVDCTAVYCPDCKGGQTFAACGGPGNRIGCGPCPPTCAGLDEVSCKGTSGCTPEYCPNCSGGKTFAGCAPPGGAPFACSAACPAPVSCASVATEAACDTRPDCHSVFVDPGTCDCAVAGCCTSFSHCADGSKAACKGTSVCQIATPYCEAPAYVVSYTASCFEGCVRPTECAP